MHYRSSEDVYRVQTCLSIPCMAQMPGERRPGITCVIDRECSHIVVDCTRGIKAHYGLRTQNRKTTLHSPNGGITT
jgi:hypothetical protein